MRVSTRKERTGGLDDERADNWRKSSQSMSNGNCVEVAELSGELIGVRDSKNPRGPVLRFTRADWDAFVSGIRTGEFGQE